MSTWALFLQLGTGLLAIGIAVYLSLPPPR